MRPTRFFMPPALLIAQQHTLYYYNSIPWTNKKKREKKIDSNLTNAMIFYFYQFNILNGQQQRGRCVHSFSPELIPAITQRLVYLRNFFFPPLLAARSCGLIIENHPSSPINFRITEWIRGRRFCVPPAVVVNPESGKPGVIITPWYPRKSIGIRWACNDED